MKKKTNNVIEISKLYVWSKPKNCYVKGKIGELEDSTEETILSAALKNNKIKNKKEKMKVDVASNLYLIKFLELINRGNT